MSSVAHKLHEYWWNDPADEQQRDPRETVRGAKLVNPN